VYDVYFAVVLVRDDEDRRERKGRKIKASTVLLLLLLLSLLLFTLSCTGSTSIVAGRYLVPAVLLLRM